VLEGVDRVSYVRKQPYLSSAQEQAWQRLARAEGRSEADVIREALGEYLQRRTRSSHPFLDLIGMVRSGAGTGSAHHDDIYDRQ
jgi:hypothetical protein